MTTSNDEQRTVAIVGVGAMGGAIADGLLATPGLRVQLCDRHPARHTDRVAAGASLVSLDAVDADVVVIATKPAGVRGVLDALPGTLRETAAIVSVAAGVPLRALVHPRHAVARAMPNIGALAGRSTTGLVCPAAMPAEARDAIRAVLAACGTVVDVEEREMHAVIGLAGSGPAFFLQAVEAMIDAGVAQGLRRADATRLAFGGVDAAVAMLSQVAGDPDRVPALKSAITSPGGTTIAGVLAYDGAGGRAAMHAAVAAAADRSRAMEAERG